MDYKHKKIYLINLKYRLAFGEMEEHHFTRFYQAITE